MKKWKWMPILSSVIFLLAGIWFLVDPDGITNILPYAIGTLILIVGLEQILYSICTKEYTFLPGFRLTQGMISVLLGIVFLVKQDFSIAVLGMILGVWALISSAIKLNVSLQEKTLGFSWFGDFLIGILQMVFGFLLIFNPFKGISTWIMIVGIYFILTGISILLSLHYFSKWLDGTR